MMEGTRLVSATTVLLHDKPEDCWIVVEDQVWDVTRFVPEHPGGASSTLFLRAPGSKMRC